MPGVRTDRSAPGLQEGEWLRSHGKASSPAFGMVRAADGHLWWGDRCHIRRVQREGQQPGSGNEEQVGRLPCLFSSRPRRGSAWERQRGCGSGSGGSQAEAGEQPNVGRAPRWASMREYRSPSPGPALSFAPAIPPGCLAGKVDHLSREQHFCLIFNFVGN